MFMTHGLAAVPPHAWNAPTAASNTTTTTIGTPFLLRIRGATLTYVIVPRGMVLVRTLIVLMVVAACGVARADIDSPDVLAGVAAYNDLDYDKAINRLQKALRTTL